MTSTHYVETNYDIHEHFSLGSQPESVGLASSVNSSLNLPWQVLLTEHFFDQILLPVGWYSYLPQLYQRTPANACLKVTITAASMFLAANQQHNFSILHKARLVYASALQAVNKTLNHPERCLDDETLSSILILNVLDDIAGHKSFSCGTHLDGCAQLIKLRDARGFHTDLSPDLAHSVVIQTQPQLMQGKNFGMCLPDDDGIHTWMMTQTLQTPASKVSTFSLQVGKMKCIVNSLLSDEAQCPAPSLTVIIESIVDLDAKMKNWHLCGDSRWTRKTTEWYLPSGKRSDADYYSDVQVSKVWNHWRDARMILHSALIDLVAHIQSSKIDYSIRDLESTREGSMRTINDMIAGVCASIPFHLQKIDATGRPSTQRNQRILGGCALIWPLQMVIKCKWAAQTERQRAIEALQVIGNDIGVKQALVSLQEVLCSENRTVQLY